MDINQDQPLKFHQSINSLLDSFRHIIASATWQQVSINKAQEFFEPYPYIVELPCSVTEKNIKIDKSILKLIEQERFNKIATPLYSQSLVNLYRIFTIAIIDIIWSEKDFKKFYQNTELQFLRHLRNGSAHNNTFFFEKGKRRERILKKLPITWREKIIEESLEKNKIKVFMDFMKPGDIFILLSDINSLLI